MNPEALHALTAARGAPMPVEEGVAIDQLAELFRREVRLRRLVDRLKRSGEICDDQISTMAKYFGCQAAGKNTRTIRAAEWSHAECAQAGQGMAERHWMAMRYTYALDDSVFHSLARELWEWALARREVERWPHRIVTLAGVEAAYMRDLVDMWMLEVRAPWRFKREVHDPHPDVRRVIMNVSEQVWRKRLSPIYESIHAEFNVWLAIAGSHMQRRLKEPSAQC